MISTSSFSRTVAEDLSALSSAPELLSVNTTRTFLASFRAPTPSNIFLVSFRALTSASGGTPAKDISIKKKSHLFF